MATIIIKSDDGNEDFSSVVGYALIVVTATEDGGLNIDRRLAVHASTKEDSQVVGDFIKTADAKLSELFPEEEQSKIWVPE